MPLRVLEEFLQHPSVFKNGNLCVARTSRDPGQNTSPRPRIRPCAGIRLGRILERLGRLGRILERLRRIDPGTLERLILERLEGILERWNVWDRSWDVWDGVRNLWGARNNNRATQRLPFLNTERWYSAPYDTDLSSPVLRSTGPRSQGLRRWKETRFSVGKTRSWT